MALKKFCLLLLILPFFLGGTPLPMTGAQPLLGKEMGEAERDKKIDAALYHYYSGETREAKKVAQELKERFPEDPFSRELMAEILWQELEKTVAAGQDRHKKVNPKTIKGAEYLMEQFYNEVNNGLMLTRPTTNQDVDSRRLFLRGMLLIRRSGFMAKFEPGIKSYAEADATGAEGIRLVQRSIEIDPSLCSAKYILALSKYFIIRMASENIFNKLVVRFRSRVFAALGGNFNANDAFVWVKESMSCGSPYYYTKDVNIDKRFAYQEILIDQAGKMDKEALPVLEELNAMFPNNKTIRDNLFLVRLHLAKRK